MTWTVNGKKANNLSTAIHYQQSRYQVNKDNKLEGMHSLEMKIPK